jgi:hypothetical protein
MNYRLLKNFGGNVASKRLLSTVAFLGLTSVGAFAYSTQVLNWSFRAPSLSDPDAIDPKTAGDIVFDTGTDKFVGWDGGNWVDFAGTGTTSNLSVASKTSAYTLVTSDDLILADANSAAFTLSLPTAVGNQGKVFKVKKTDTTYNAVTIDPNSTEQVDGNSTTTLNTKGETLTVVSDGSNWQILAREIPFVWSSYTPSMDGFVDSGAACQYARQGQDLLLRCKVSPSSINASEARFYLPSASLVSASSTTLPGIQICGSGNQDDWQPAVEPSKNYVVLVDYAATSTVTTKLGGSTAIGLTQPSSFTCRIPIAGWN